MANMADTVNNVLRVRLYSFCRDQLAVNVLHYKVFQNTLNPTTTDVQVATALDTLFRTVYRDALSFDAKWVGADAVQITPVLGVVSHTTLPVADGNDASPVLPLQTTGIVRKTTLLGGRAFRGRAYIPFPSTAAQDTDFYPTALYVAKLQLIANRIADTGVITLNGTDSMRLTGLIWHREVEDPPQPAYSTVLAGAVGIRKFAVQRRRGDYGRQNPLPW